MDDLAAKGVRTGGGIGGKRNEFYLGNTQVVGLSDYAKTVPVMAGSVQAESVL